LSLEQLRIELLRLCSVAWNEVHRLEGFGFLLRVAVNVGNRCGNNASRKAISFPSPRFEMIELYPLGELVGRKSGFQFSDGTVKLFG